MKTVLLIFGIVLVLYFLAISTESVFRLYLFVWLVLGVGLILPSLVPTDGIPMVIKVLWALVYLTVFLGMIVLHVWNRKLCQKGEQEDGDILILLGCKVPSRAMNSRADAALRWWDRHGPVPVVCTGGQGRDEAITEAQGYRQVLLEHGIAEAHILLEERSTSTHENLVFSDEMYHTKQKKTGIVTSEFHMFRSLAMARKLGYREVFGIGGKTPAFYLPNYLMREELAIIKALLKGSL